MTKEIARVLCPHFHKRIKMLFLDRSFRRNQLDREEVLVNIIETHSRSVSPDGDLFPRNQIIVD